MPNPIFLLNNWRTFTPSSILGQQPLKWLESWWLLARSRALDTPVSCSDMWTIWLLVGGVTLGYKKAHNGMPETQDNQTMIDTPGILSSQTQELLPHNNAVYPNPPGMVQHILSPLSQNFTMPNTTPLTQQWSFSLSHFLDSKRGERSGRGSVEKRVEG